MIKILTSVIFLISINICAQNGIVKTYFMSGKVESRVSFVDEILEGTSFWYFENGNLKMEKNYSNGKLNGISRVFYSNGLLKNETHIDNGMIHGVKRSYWENGALKEIKTYTYGELISVNNLNYDSLYIAPLSAYAAGKKRSNIETNDFLCSVEICPEPLGGIEEIESNIVYPDLAKQFGLEGSVLVIATIDKLGIPQNIKLLTELGLGCSEAAVEAVKKTRFIPGMENGNEVTSDVTFSVNFRLEKKDKKNVNVDHESEIIVEDAPIEKVTDFIVCELESCPKPIGGITELLTKLRYPPHAKRNGVSGDVIVKAKINEIGFVISAEVIKGIGSGCDEAAKSVVIKTQFEPGKLSGKDVESTIEITVPFILDENKRNN